jgi:hypothetical protein
MAIAESSAGAQWPSSSDAATAQPNAVKFATTSYAGATKLLLSTWATAITSPQANVTDSRMLTTDLSLPAGYGWLHKAVPLDQLMAAPDVGDSRVR